MSPLLKWISSVSLALALGASCSDPSACSLTSDCFEAEICIDGRCAVPPLASPDMGSAGVQDASVDTGREDEPDQGREDEPDVAISTDAGVADAAPDLPDIEAGVCIVDPFESCPIDDDDRFAEQITNVGFGRGCVRVDDNFEGGTVRITDRTLCPREQADRYSIGVNPCQTTSFFVDVKVTPREQCLLDDWSLEARLAGLTCSSADVQCGEDGAAKTATFIVRPVNSVLALSVNVLPVAENLRFDYDLEITYRQ